MMQCVLETLSELHHYTLHHYDVMYNRGTHTYLKPECKLTSLMNIHAQTYLPRRYFATCLHTIKGMV